MTKFSSFGLKTGRKIVSVASQLPEEEAHTLIMAQSTVRKDVLNHNTPFRFDDSFPKDR